MRAVFLLIPSFSFTDVDEGKGDAKTKLELAPYDIMSMLLLCCFHISVAQGDNT